MYKSPHKDVGIKSIWNEILTLLSSLTKTNCTTMYVCACNLVQHQLISHFKHDRYSELCVKKDIHINISELKTAESL